MSWLNFRRNQPEPDPDPAPGATPEPRRTMPRGQLPPTPSNAPAAALTPEARANRIATLERRREAVRFDLERSELANQPDNPWQQRIALLTESLATVDADRQRLSQRTPEPSFPVPATPIVDLWVRTEEPAEVQFMIQGLPFVYIEEIDWAERGTLVVHGDLRRQTGDVAALLPENLPANLREPLLRHLLSSLFVFATELRDRAFDHQSLPEAPTLADLAKPCPVCGGWTDWKSRCPACTRHATANQALNSEAERLRGERDKEAEDQHRWAERLPIARRRLTEIDNEIAALGG